MGWTGDVLEAELTNFLMIKMGIEKEGGVQDDPPFLT